VKNDPIVTEVREVRQKLAARFNYDLEAIFADARKRQSSSGHEVISLNPRIPGTPGTPPRRFSRRSGNTPPNGNQL